jgi:hypothetical protein
MGGAFTDHVSWRWCFYVRSHLITIAHLTNSTLYATDQPTIWIFGEPPFFHSYVQCSRLLTSKQSILAVLFFLKSTPVMDIPGNENKSRLQKWIGIDWLGTVLCLGMIIPLMLALQWGGNTRAWNDPVIIVCFVVVRILKSRSAILTPVLIQFAVVMPMFVLWQ